MDPEMLGHIFSFAVIILFWCFIIWAMKKMNKQIKERMAERFGILAKVVAEEKQCPPHKWRYDSNGRMYCAGKCQQRAGFIRDEPGI